MKITDENFWLTNQSNKFNQFALAIPSEKIAYTMAYYFLQPYNKTILDFGCFQGISSNNILQLGAKKVLGVDQNKEHIGVAKEKFRDETKLEFMYVPVNEKISLQENVDAVAMTFVHPTIQSYHTLKDSIKKISESVRKGGDLVLLGLHPDAVQDAYRQEFVYYDLQLLGTKYQDEAKFHNTLKLPSGEKLEFDDICWTTKTLVDTINSADFKVLHSGSILDKNIIELYGKQAEKTFYDIKDHVDKETKTIWGNEWDAPLYQIILAKKL